MRIGAGDGLACRPGTKRKDLMPMPTELRRMTYSVDEAAALLGVSKSKLYDSVRNGELRAIQIGRRVVIPCDVLEELVGPISSPTDGAEAAPRGPAPLGAQGPSTPGGADINAVHLAGTVVRNPQVRASRSGLEVCTLQLAIRRRRRDGEERGALRVDVVAFGALATAIGSFQQGATVAVTGRLGQREWTSSDGSQHARFEVVAEAVDCLAPATTAS